MKILVLAGGFDQKDFILELKKRGHQVLLADYYPHPPAKGAADAFFQISTLDVDAVRDLATREQVDRVTTACTDQALLTAARVSEELGLTSYLSFDAARSVTNKAYMKEILNKNSIPTAPYWITNGQGDESENHDPKIPYPRVVKPVDSNSSRGVKKVANPAEMAAAITAAVTESRTRTAVVEAFLPGDEVSVDAYVQSGRAEVLMMSYTVKVPDTDSFTIVQSRVPARVNSAAAERIRTICTDIARAFSLPDTPLLVQCVVKDDEAWVLEFSARMGGGTKHRLIRQVTGVDLMAVFADRVEDKFPCIEMKQKAEAASLTYCYGSAGEFHRLEGVEALLKQGLIADCFTYKTPGMVLEKASTSGDRVCGFLITGKDRTDVAEKEAAAGRILKILDPTGRDLFRRDLLPPPGQS